MASLPEDHVVQSEAWRIATRWCSAKGTGWAPIAQLGRGGTAPVFEVQSPFGVRALKIYDAEFSSGKMGEIEDHRIQQQLQLRNHDCKSLIQIYEGGMVAGRHFLLMSRAPGMELEKCLPYIPRSKIRTILHDVAKACQFLHGRGLCHRDIKAANVFVTEDFDHATLLDISVIRAIHDPVGVGSDHDGQLPVLATARYSPPEYLFRLIEPSPSLWHALNIYQLGALLHDLLVRVPLFQTEYEQSKSNRYRFAWIVATEEPHIDVPDAEQDLVFLARRALDKDWERRSVLDIRDFFNHSLYRKQQALQMLGLHRRPSVNAPIIQEERKRLDQISSALENHLVAYFRKAQLTAVHEIKPCPGSDNSRIIQLSWQAHVGSASAVQVSLRCRLQSLVHELESRFAVVIFLSKQENGETKSAEMNLPDVPDDAKSSATLASQCEQAFENLAQDLLHPSQ